MASIHSLPSLADVDRRTIDEIAGALTAGWPVESIILYGSKARGDDTPESDIDLLVLTSRPLTAEEIGQMRAVARQIGLRLGTWPELYIRTSDEWWRGVYQAAPIRKEIDAEGIDVVRVPTRGGDDRTGVA
ncbi:nucleotidyltransferase domain-containing protein [bacterium]|nr:nucleotidyltransferase domain-containing protein [bacterium]